MLYPLPSSPIFKERVWGGRKLERLYHKPLPPGVPIGESWEISDRPGDVSVIANGPAGGQRLALADGESRRRPAGGDRSRKDGRFPLLIKILDAQDNLSLQVHPPGGQGGRARRRAEDRDVVYRRRGAGSRASTSG